MDIVLLSRKTHPFHGWGNGLKSEKSYTCQEGGRYIRIYTYLIDSVNNGQAEGQMIRYPGAPIV